MVCVKCGYQAQSGTDASDCAAARDQLFAFTLTQPRPPFIHQLAVDAYAAQHLDEDDSAISRLFPLIGLSMVCELGATGYEVQLAHMRKTNDPHRSQWPLIDIRPEAFSMNVSNVLMQTSDSAKEKAIMEWVHTTWAAYAYAHALVREFCR